MLSKGLRFFSIRTFVLSNVVFGCNQAKLEEEIKTLESQIAEMDAGPKESADVQHRWQCQYKKVIEPCNFDEYSTD